MLAGVPPEKIIEAHGSFQTAHCTGCKEIYDLRWLKREIFSPEGNDGVPKCEQCEGVVRPDVVLFGESLPNRFWTSQTEDFAACDLLLVLGTSLTVSPFNGLVGKPRASVPRVYINLTRPGAAPSLLTWALGMAARVDFGRASDLVILGEADTTVRGPPP
jgi:NAD-dependent deacetylase sirtuin 2